MKPIEITDFESQVFNAQRPVFIEFMASWCPTCRLFRPVLFQLAQALEDVTIAYADYDKHKDTAEKLDITTLPTLLYFKDGKEQFRKTGYVRRDELIEEIRK